MGTRYEQLVSLERLAGLLGPHIWFLQPARSKLLNRGESGLHGSDLSGLQPKRSELSWRRCRIHGSDGIERHEFCGAGAERRWVEYAELDLVGGRSGSAVCHDEEVRGAHVR